MNRYKEDIEEFDKKLQIVKFCVDNTKINEDCVSFLNHKLGRPRIPWPVMLTIFAYQKSEKFSDERMEKELQNNPKLREALGIPHLKGVSRRTLSTYRGLISRVKAEKGYDIDRDALYQIALAFAHRMNIPIRKLRVDTTMVDSACRRMNRKQLAYHVAKDAALDMLDSRVIPPECRRDFPREYKKYLDPSYRVKDICEVQEGAIFSPHPPGEKQHDLTLGKLLERCMEMNEYVQRLGERMGEKPGKTSKKIARLERLITEQTKRGTEGRIFVRHGKEIAGNSLQSTTDHEATFRRKNNKSSVGYASIWAEFFYRFGPSREISLIIYSHTLPNVTSDRSLAKAFLRSPFIPFSTRKIVSDGAFHADDLKQMAKEKNIKWVTTGMPGRKTSGKMGWDQFPRDTTGEIIACPRGQKPIVSSYRENKDPKKASLHAQFSKESCQDCPFKESCPTRKGTRVNSLHCTEHQIEIAIQRNQLGQPEMEKQKAYRAATEGVAAAVKGTYHPGYRYIRGLARMDHAQVAITSGYNMNQMTAFLEKNNRWKGGKRGTSRMPATAF